MPAMYRIGTQKTAAICLRGHVITTDIDRLAKVPKFCTQCGAEVVTTCQIESCQEPLPGELYGHSTLVPDPWRKPLFCGGCGTAHDWLLLGQQQFSEFVDATDAPEEEKRAVKDALPEIARDEPSLGALNRVKRFVERFLTDPSSRAILVNVMSDAAKKWILGG